MQDQPLQNWIPYKLFRENGQWLCKWLYAADKKFSEPFFDETILACQKHPHNSSSFSSTSTLDVLHDLSGSLPFLPPAAFIFHISRCGSTLLSQLLGEDEHTVCLAEVPFFDELLRLPYKDQAHEKSRGGILKAAISLHAQTRSGHEKHVFIKLDSWHIFFYDTIRALYPAVPCVLLYRSPDEVLASHRRHRGMQAVPGLIEPELFGLTPQDIQNKSHDEYTACVLERYLLRFSEAAHDDQALLLNYNEGAMPMLERLLAHARVSHDEEVMQKMKARSVYHSKHPGRTFSEDKSEKINPAYMKGAMAAYDRLEAARLKNRT